MHLVSSKVLDAGPDVLSCDVPEDLPPVDADPALLERVVANMARHLAPGGVLVAGFQLQPGRLGVERYDEIATAAGLALSERWATWDRGAWDPHGEYALSVHRLR